MFNGLGFYLRAPIIPCFLQTKQSRLLLNHYMGLMELRDATVFSETLHPDSSDYETSLICIFQSCTEHPEINNPEIVCGRLSGVFELF